MKLDVYLDMDLVVYRAAAAVQEAHNWDDDEWGLTTTHCDHNQAVLLIKRIVDSTLSCIKENHEIDFVAGCFSCPSSENFRLGFDPTYKMNRRGVSKPIALPKLREIAMDPENDFGYEVLGAANLEADDVLGIFGSYLEDEVLMVSDDKDLLTVPGLHMKFPRQGQYEMVLQSKDKANLALLTQCLTGDDADGIKGIKGIGPVKAKRLLSGLDTKAAYETVLNEYTKAGQRERFERTFRLLYILRNHNQEKPVEEILGIK
jgi:5'-3' exonuclease